MELIFSDKKHTSDYGIMLTIWRPNKEGDKTDKLKITTIKKRDKYGNNQQVNSM